MRHIILFFAILLAGITHSEAASYSVSEIPNVQVKSRYNFTSNPDGILSRDVVAQIDSICYALKVSNIAQVAVVAVDQITEENKSITADPFDFAYKLFSAWGVGREGRNNGVGILFVGDQRQIRFVTGLGVEGVLPDAICKRIQMERMIPYFRKGDYNQGILAGVRSVEAILANSELNVGGSDYYPEAGRGSGDGIPDYMIYFLVLGVIVCMTIYSLIKYYKSAKCPNCGKFTFHTSGETLLRVEAGQNVMQRTFRCSSCSHSVTKVVHEPQIDSPIFIPPIGGSRHGGGGGGFGGFGGGGGGFGGGRFGGGGSGSGW